MEFRVGLGYDIHRLAKGKKLILGGVEIPFSQGIVAHSDGDVLIHALMDAMLGALGLRDIGYFFSPDEESYSGIDSRELLKKVYAILKENKFEINNIDGVIVAEAPRLSDYIEKMKENIALILEMPSSRISIKATTCEGIGFIGKGEGIASWVIVSIIGEGKE